MGQDSGMDASPSWKELKDERDQARRERDIHAANLSAIRIALGVLHAAGREDDAEVAAANLARVIEGAGDARYMKRLKAQWQAEALEEAAERVALAEYAESVRSHLRAKADKLRRQAEGCQ